MKDKPTHRVINSQKPNNSRRHQLINPQTPQIQSPLTQSSPTQKLPNSKTHQLKSSPTQKLKLLSFILQYRSNFRSVLAKILVKKLVKSHCFYPLTPWGLSIFKPKTCILHHLAFLVWLLTHIFSTPNTCF